MVEEAKRTLAYLCPVCRQSVAANRSLFQLAAGPNELPCPCGKSSLAVEMTGDQVRLTVPCLFCGKDHLVACSSRTFLREPVLAFSCAASSLDCCYIGEEDLVFSALRHLEQTADKMEAQAGTQGCFLDEMVMLEVLSELKEIAQRDGISCTCGGHSWNLQVNFSAILLTCADCGGVTRIPAATAEDITAICCRDKLVIPKANPGSHTGGETP